MARFFGWDANRGEAPQAHQHVAVTRKRHHAPVGTGKSEAEADHCGAAHGAPEIKIQRVVAGGGDVIGRRAKAGNDEEIAAVDQELLYELTPVEHHRIRYGPLLGADQALREKDRDLKIAVERHVAAGADNLVDHVGRFDPVGEKPAEPQHILGHGAHGHLPRIEFAELTAHRDEHDAAEAAIAQQRKHVDAIADAARLHEQRRPLAAERGAGNESDALFLGGQHDVGDLRIVTAQRDKPAMAGVGHVTDLADADAAKVRVDRIRPGRFDVCRAMQGRSLFFVGNIARQTKKPSCRQSASMPPWQIRGPFDEKPCTFA